MGRKGGGGSLGVKQQRRQSELSPAIVHKRIDASKINHLSFDDIADHLYSSYPDYKQYKFLPFRTKVNQILLNSHRRPMISPQNDAVGGNADDDDDDDGVEEKSPGPRRKKQRGMNEWEEKLLQRGKEEENIEVEDVRKGKTAASLMGTGGKSTSEVVEENMEAEDVRKEKTVSSLMGRGGKSTSEVVEGKESVNNKGNQGPRFKDFGGMKAVLEELKMEVIFPFKNPNWLHELGVKPMVGILLHGPPGCGKTKLAHAIANEARAPFYPISATDIVSGVSGASEENIRDLFSKAHRTAPSIVFIDEIDAIGSKRENLQREMDRRIVTQLLTCMEESHGFVQSNDKNSDSEASDKRSRHVLVIGATNRPDAVDPALRRPGRFDREILLGVPDENARLEILSVLTQNLTLSGDFAMTKIAKATPGFVGADLAALADKAGNLAMKRNIVKTRLEMSKESGEDDENWWSETRSPVEKLSITMSDFEEAAKMVQPSLRREGFSSIPDVKWDDVGGLDVLRKEFDSFVVRRIKYPEIHEESGVDMETGFLLYGPHGCGKTLIAKAVANEAGANFIHIKGPELLNKYVGEGELHVRTIFTRARTCAPCILFFDEVDAWTTKRGKEGGWVVERLLSQLLIELDGADKRRGVYVFGATNRPEVMDDALLRPGRFGRPIFVPLPSPDERGMILKALVRKKPIDASVDLLALGKSPSCEDLSGADLKALVYQAAFAALDEKLSAFQDTKEGFYDNTAPFTIKSTHFEQALRKVSPSVTAKQKQHYQLLSKQFSNNLKS